MDSQDRLVDKISSTAPFNLLKPSISCALLWRR